jgi:nucleotide-binding universal stress UspA family protein
MANLFRRILCPVDFDPNAIVVIGMARQVAEQTGAKVILFHVVPVPIQVVGQPIALEPFTAAETSAKMRLEKLAGEHLGGTAVSYETFVTSGDPASEIVRAVREQNADLVVMATHGRTGLSHLILGSVAERVVRESPRPVLTVRALRE